MAAEPREPTAYDKVILNYARFLVRRPRTMLTVFTLAVFGLLASVLIRLGGTGTNPFRYFSEPDKGFEPRGTPLSNKLLASSRMLEKAQCEGTISGRPDKRTYARFAYWDDPDFERTWCKDPDRASFDDRGSARRLHSDEGQGRRQLAAAAGPSLSDVRHGTCSYAWQLSRLRYWPMAIVFEPAAGDVDLFSLEPIKGMCRVDDLVRSQPSFARACATVPGRREFRCSGKQCLSDDGWERSEDTEHSCCPSRSVGSYVALLARKASCDEITADDVSRAKALLEKCAPGFHDKANPELGICADPENAEGWALCRPSWEPGMNATTGEAFSTVSECHRGNIAWDLLSALLDLNYLKSDAGVTRPRFARVLVPGNDWDFGYEFNLESSDLLHARIGDNFGGARLVSFDNGVKFKMFTNLLLTVDMPLIITGLFLILGMLVLYSGSLFIALLAILSFLLANFLGVVFVIIFMWLPFFPFLNATATFICLGIAADDVFVLLQAYDDEARKRGGTPRDDDEGLAELLAAALSDAGGATLVTSLTTAGAFISTSASSVTSIRAFGAFCAAVTMSAWLLLVSYCPAIIVTYVKHVQSSRAGVLCGQTCFGLFSGGGRLRLNNPFEPSTATGMGEDAAGHKPAKGAEQTRGGRPALAARFERLLGPVITHRSLRFVWLGGLAALSVGLITQAPNLTFPETAQLQILPSEHPVERYCCVGPKHADEFILGGIDTCSRFSATMVFGVEPADNGNYWDPSPAGTGALQLRAVDLSSKRSQEFLLDVCERARKADWFDKGDISECDRGTDFKCSVERLVEALKTSCSSPMRLSSACCGLNESHHFPYEPGLFRECVGEYQKAFEDFAFFFERDGDEGTDTPVALRLNFPTGRQRLSTYATNAAFDVELTAWAEGVLRDAPAELSGGYAYSENFWFYALLDAIGSSAFSSTVLSAGVAFAVIIALTQNVLIAVYATVTIALIIGSVTGVFALNGWSLGVLESICFATGIGLACDFVAHLGYAYRQGMRRGEASDRIGLVLIAVRRMAPSTTAAAVSTSVMGVMMLGSATQFSRNFGEFLLLLMTFSWSFAFFGMLPLLSLVGPLGSVGNLPFGFVLRLFQRRRRRDEPADAGGSGTTSRTASLPATHA